MRLKLAAMVAALLFSGAAPLLAQESTSPPQPRRPIDALKAILELTDLQLQQLGDLRQAHQQKIREINTKNREMGKQQREVL